MTSKKETEITILSEILRINKQEGYKDDDNYVSQISGIYYQYLSEKRDLEWGVSKIRRIRTNFFRFNRVKKLEYLQKLFTHLNKKQITIPQDKKQITIPQDKKQITIPQDKKQITIPQDKKRTPLTICDIFPEIKKIKNLNIKNIDETLSKIYESVIQNELRNALRDKGASPIPRRGKDSALEVADIEHFYLDINSKKSSFTVVVKGHKSLGGSKKFKKLNWKSVSYQVSKAHNRTNSDYVILVSALEPVDSVISEMQLEGKARGNPHLVVFMPPLELAKFLRWRKII